MGYYILRTLYPGGLNLPVPQGNPYKDRGQSKLGVLFGPEVFEELTDKTVLDFGCGDGENCIELAQRGVKRVIGLDIQETCLAVAREEAARRGMVSKCQFVSHTDQQADVVLSTDAFDHFDDPAAILREMARLLQPTGYVLIEFGYTWYHPYGGQRFQYSCGRI